MDRAVVRYVRQTAVAAALSVALLVALFEPSSRITNGLLWAAVGAVVLSLTEIPFAHVRYRPHGEALSLGEGVLFVLFGLFTPSTVVLIGLAAMVAQLSRRAPFIRWAFNLSQYVVSVGTGSLVAHLIGRTAAMASPMHLFSCVAGVAVYAAVNRALVTRVISLANRQSWVKTAKEGIGIVALSTAGLVPIGGLALVLAVRVPLWLPLLAAPLFAFFLAQRRAIEGNRRVETTDALLALGSDISRVIDLEARVLVLADGIRSMLGARAAEVVLFSPAEDAVFTKTSLEDPAVVLEPFSLEAAPNPYAHCLASGQGQLYIGGTGEGPIVESLAARGVKDLVTSPMTFEGTIQGILLAYDRLGPEHFGEDDRKMLGGIAHIAIGALVSAQAYAAERSAAERLRELDRMKSDLIASVSHEFRTPLTVIYGMATTLEARGEALDEETKTGFISRIVRSSERLHRLVEGVLGASRWEMARQEDTTFVSMSDAVREALDQLSDLTQKRTIVLEIDDDLPHVRAASERLELIVRNLVENAVKYSSPESAVDVRATRVAGGVAVEVVDRGPGIPLDHQQRIFERFYQIDQSATREVGGTGLGLYLVKSLTEAIGGRVEVESRPGIGSTFRVVLPATVAGEADVIPFPRRQERLR